MTQDEKDEKIFSLWIHTYNLMHGTTWDSVSVLDDEVMSEAFLKHYKSLVNLPKKHRKQSTSVRALLSCDQDAQINRVLNCIKSVGPICAIEISSALDMTINCVTPAVTNLKKAGYIKVAYEAKSPVTKHEVQYYTV